MEKLLFIINPVAGRGRSKELISLIEEEMKSYGADFSIKLTKGPEDAIELVCQSKTDHVIAVGGDGTVTEVAKGIIKRGYGTIGIIPAGTGNDFIKSLDISKDPRQALKTIRQAKTKKIDIGLANGHKFLNIGSVGLDAEVVQTAQRVKKSTKSHLSYILSVFIALIRFKRKEVTLVIDGRKEEKSLVLFAIGNGKYYGGGLKMIPGARLDDGFLHICLVEKISKLRILTIFPELFKGSHIRHKKYTETFQAKKVKLYSQEELYMNLDGDIFLAGNQIEFSLSTEKLNIIIP